MTRGARRTQWAQKASTPILALLVAALCAAAYLPGLGGGFLFDDYPNIVDNRLVQPATASVSDLTAAAMSSPSSELKRPLASLSFAADFLANGLDPASMKLTNIIIHGINGLLVFFLARLLLRASPRPGLEEKHVAAASLVVTAWWMLAPINLTAVLYIVQRMESMANLFVLAGLIGYTRQRMIMLSQKASAIPALGWMIVPTLIGLLAKETAVLLPLYALCIEGFIFKFRSKGLLVDWRVAWTFVIILGVPLIAGSAWVAPGILDAHTWATRDFTLATRLLSEPRIIISYASWIIFPFPDLLSFYHDDFVASTGLLTPWTTAGCVIALVCALLFAIILRRRLPLAGLGITLFFACQTLTGTVLPLELIYEHRNYFASLGIILAVVDLGMAAACMLRRKHGSGGRALSAIPCVAVMTLLLYSASVTVSTATEWGTPLHLAEELAKRAPGSPRAMYELGRAYIIASRYHPASPYLTKAHDALERAAALPASSILPEQALVFLNSRMGIAIPERWWSAMQQKLADRPATIQDESSLITLSSCRAEGACIFPSEPLQRLFATALSHPAPTARLFFGYGQFASSALHDSDLALKMTERAVGEAPREPAYRETLVRLLIRAGHLDDASKEIELLRQQNLQGRLDREISNLTKEMTLAGSSGGNALR